jgi:multiple sugar transport system substrate-binding protein
MGWEVGGSAAQEREHEIRIEIDVWDDVQARRRNQMIQGTTKLSRRTIGKAAAGAAIGIASTGAASSVFAAPAYLRLQSNPVEITFAHIWGVKPGDAAPETKHPVDQLIDAFNALGTGVTVISRTDSGNYQETLSKVQAELAAGDPPALVTTPWSNIEMAIEGLGVNNLNEMVGTEVDAVLGSLRQEVIPLVQQDGNTFGIPFAFSSPVFYYNADVFNQAGLTEETVFADWTSFAAALPTLKEATGNAVFATFVNHDWPAQALIQCNGGSIYDEEGNLAIDSPEAIEAMHVWADYSAQGYYFKSLISEVRPAFVAGSIPVATGSVASLGGLSKEVQFELGTASYPVFPGKPRKMPSGGSFIGCYAREDEQKQAAWEFLKYVVTDEAAQIWSQTGYLNATTHEVPVLPGQDAAIAHLEEGLTRETPWPGQRAAEIQVTWGKYVEQIWLGDISVEEGIEMAKSEMESLAG